MGFAWCRKREGVDKDMATVREVGEGDLPVLEFTFKMTWASYT